MTAIRVVNSSGSLGDLQSADGSGGFQTGSLVAGSNISITHAPSGTFTIAATGGGGGSITVEQAGGISVNPVSTMVFTGSIVTDTARRASQNAIL